MKKIILAAALAIVCSSAVFAQNENPVKDRKKEIKERTAITKLEQKALSAKVTKDAKASAKQMKKEGWKAAPGSMPLEKQLDALYVKKYEMEGTFPKYIVGNIFVTAGNAAAARKQAMTLAQVEIAEQIGAEIAELVENSVNNKSMSSDDAESLTSMVDASKTLVKQKLGRTQVALEAYRTLPNGKIECQITVTYDGHQAKSAIMQAFEGQSKEAQEKLAKILEGEE